jgi:hypothetical protein
MLSVAASLHISLIGFQARTNDYNHCYLG